MGHSNAKVGHILKELMRDEYLKTHDAVPDELDFKAMLTIAQNTFSTQNWSDAFLKARLYEGRTPFIIKTQVLDGGIETQVLVVSMRELLRTPPNHKRTRSFLHF